jgi:hypothetical protein
VHQHGIHDWCEHVVPAMCEGGRVGCSNAVSDYTTCAIVQHETRVKGQVNIGFIPEIKADGARGFPIEPLIDGGEKLAACKSLSIVNILGY